MVFCVLPHSRCLHRSRPFIVGTLRRAQKVLRLLALRVSPTIVENDSTNFLKTVSLCRACLCKYMLPFQPLHPRRRRFVPCQVGFVNGSPSGSQSKTHSRKLIWKSGSLSGMYLLKGQAPQIRVKSSPRLLGCRTLPLRYFGSLRSPMIKNVFWNELMHHCLRCGHDQNVISFIRNSSVPFPNAWNCPFRAMISCQATKNSNPQEMIFLLHGPHWASTKSWSSMWWTLRRLQQSFARHLKENTLPLLTWKVPENALRPVRLCKGDSASTTGTLDPDGEKKMPSRNKSQEGGISLPWRRRPTTLTTSFSRIASTWLIMQVARFSSTRTPSTPTSMSSPSTATTPDES